MKPEPAPPVDARYAWRQISKAEPPKRSATSRVRDFLEIYSFLDEETARQQALRCVECPEPTCVEGCPVHSRIPEWMALVAEGRFLEASQILQASSCMEEIFSRLCSHPCEPRCILDGKADPVAINAIERFLHDYGFTHGGVDVTLPPLNGLKVAVMNAGPCGLTCAFDLVRKGYQVTVYDHRATAGGLLAYGIPGFKMEHSLLQRRLEMLQKLGVRFLLGVKPGTAPTLAELRSSYHAVFFGAALGRVRSLDIPGSGLKGVHQGLAFLMQSNTEAPMEGVPIAVRGRRVVAIGAGDVAIDCLRAALRSGAADALCLYRRGEAEVPANSLEFQNAREEGVRFEFMALPVALLGDASGAVTRIQCVRTCFEGVGADGRSSSKPVPGSDFSVPADVVLAALGFDSTPFQADGDLRDIPLTADGRVIVDENLMTGVEGVFAGGTLVHGASAFLDAVRDARQVAASIDRFLSVRKAASP